MYEEEGTKLNGSNTLESELGKLLREHEDKLHSAYATHDLIKAVKYLFQEYERNAADAIMDAQRFQTEMVMWLQGLALCCHMVSNGQTHAEKDARMRGLVELIESAVGKAREYDYRLDRWNRHSYRPGDLFVNDYPVRHFKERAERAERELEELKKKVGEKQEDNSEQSL